MWNQKQSVFFLSITERQKEIEVEMSDYNCGFG